MQCHVSLSMGRPGANHTAPVGRAGGNRAAGRTGSYLITDNSACYVPHSVMTLFLLTAVPLSYLLTVALMGAQGLPRKTLVTPAIRGGILALVVYGLFYRIREVSVVSYAPADLFVRAMSLDVSGPAFVMLLGCALLCRWLFIERSTDFFIGWLSFAAGFYTIFGVIEVIYPIRYPSVFDLFLVPALRVSLMLFFASFMTAARGSGGFIRVAWIVALIGSLVLPSFVPQLFLLRYTTFSVVLTGVFAIGAVGTTYLLQGAYFRSFL